MIESFVKVEPEGINSDGSTFGFGCGDGFGCRNGHGDGLGSGLGSGSQDGSGHGGGTGCGSFNSGVTFGFGIKSFNNQKIYMIDKVTTIIKSVEDNIAKGFILKKDFTLSPCYIMKNGNIFAFGETLFEAHTVMVNKLLDNDLD